jgi:hypothetical protein
MLNKSSSSLGTMKLASSIATTKLKSILRVGSHVSARWGPAGHLLATRFSFWRHAAGLGPLEDGAPERVHLAVAGGGEPGLHVVEQRLLARRRGEAVIGDPDRRRAPVHQRPEEHVAELPPAGRHAQPAAALEPRELEHAQGTLPRFVLADGAAAVRQRVRMLLPLPQGGVCVALPLPRALPALIHGDDDRVRDACLVGDFLSAPN